MQNKYYRKAVVALILCILVTSTFLTVNAAHKENRFEQKTSFDNNKLYYDSFSPFNITLAINKTPALNDTFTITSYLKSDVEVSSVHHEIYLPDQIRHLNGNLSWNGSVIQNQIRNLTITAQLNDTGDFSVRSMVKDNNRYYENNITLLYFVVNQTNTTVRDQYPQLNPDKPLLANVTISDGPCTLGAGDNITISGHCQYEHYVENSGIIQDVEIRDISQAKVTLLRNTSNSVILEQTTYTDSAGNYCFQPCSPGNLTVNISATTEGNKNIVKVTDFDNGTVYTWTSGWKNITDNRSINFSIDSEDHGIKYDRDNYANSAWVIYHNILYAYNWMKENGSWIWPFTSLQVKWGGGGSTSYYSPSYNFIVISDSREYDTRNHFHEYGHAVMDAARGSMTSSGYDYESNCTDKGWGSGSEEYKGTAFSEGWAELFDDIMTYDYLGFDYIYEDGPRQPHLEAYADFCKEKDWNGAHVPGAVASILVDMVDGIDGNDYPDYRDIDGEEFSFSRFGDYISGEFETLMSIMDNDHPDDINDVWDEWVEGKGYKEREKLWAIFYNQRIQKDNSTPIPPDRNTSNVNLGEVFDNTDVIVNWSYSNPNLADDCSGIYGYSLLWTENKDDLPPEQSSDNLSTTSNGTIKNLPNGTWYLNVRPVDRAGRWSESFYSIGPFIVGFSNPVLSLCDDFNDQGVKPVEGDEITPFNFKVHYFDSDGHDPIEHLCFVDDIKMEFDLNGSGSNSNYTTTIDGHEMGFGKHQYYFNFTDEENGEARLPKSEENFFNVTVKPITPVITGETQVRPSIFPIWNYSILLSENDLYENLSINVTLENTYGKIIKLDFDRERPWNYTINSKYTGWYECESSFPLIRCKWSIWNYLFHGPHNCSIKVQTRYDQGDGSYIYSEWGSLEVNCSSDFLDPILQNILKISADGSYTATPNENIAMTSQINGGTPPYQITWDFGDDIIETGQNVTHSYETPGKYMIICTVEDANGTRNENITYANISGVTLSANKDSVLVNKSVNLTARLISMESNNQYWFNFSTGELIRDNDSDGIVTIGKNFQEPGLYTIKVKVHNGSSTGPVIATSNNVTIKVVPFEIDAGGPYAAMCGNPVSFEGMVYRDYQMISAQWDFGDGNDGYGLTPVHPYNTNVNTTYTATLTVSIPGVGTVNDTAEVNIWNISNPLLPHAILNDTHCGKPDESIRIDGSESTGINLTYLWKIDDGLWMENSSVISPIFPDEPGDYPIMHTVMLKVVDDKGFSDSNTTSVTVSKVQAKFSHSSSPNDIEPVDFFDQSAPHGCDDVDSWEWDFGDGTTSTMPHPSHQYSDDGYYYVTLTVSANGENDSCTKRLYVENMPPTPLLTVKPRVNTVENDTVFNSTSSDPDGTVIAWEWDFGDDMYSPERNISYQYTTSGMYPTSLYNIDDDFDQTALIKDEYVLIADAFVSISYTENTPGWNDTRFNDLQEAINAVPVNGILVVLNGSYTNVNVLINKSLDIYAVSEGYQLEDTSIQYGGVTLTGDEGNPIVSISNCDVSLKGISFVDAGKGVEIDNGDLYIEDCSFNECHYGIKATTGSTLHMTSCEITNTTTGVNITGYTTGSIMETVFSGNQGSVDLHDCENLEIIACDLEPDSYGICITQSDTVDVKDCSILGAEKKGIFIDNSKNISMEYVDINGGIIGIQVSNVTGVNTTEHLLHRVVNHIENCSFHNNEYGVKLMNADGTRIGGDFWYIQKIDKLFPTYPAMSQAGTVMSWFTPLDFPEGCLFYDIDYPLVLFDSDYTVIDGIQILPALSSYTHYTPMCAKTGISLESSDNTIVHYSKITGCNQSAIRLNNSKNTTIAFNYINYNARGVNLSECEKSLLIANSFYKNREYGVNMTTVDTMKNKVLYNDFMFNGVDFEPVYTTAMDVLQAFDNGESNRWDDNTSSPWRNWLEMETELTDNTSQGVGNYWSDYNGDTLDYTPGLGGPLPGDFNEWPPEQGGYGGSLPLPPVGNTSYLIPGSADSEDHYPVLRPFWPSRFYDHVQQENVEHAPGDPGLGEPVNITVNCSDLFHDITVMRVNVTRPNGNWTNVTMNQSNNTYWYSFDDAWATGVFNYSFWTVTSNGYRAQSDPYSFQVNSSSVTMSMCTLQNRYGSNTSLNLTDPPGGPDAPEMGYEFLDDGKVLHIWNKYDSYYFNTSSGIQLTNHFGEYWSRNVLMLGYYNNDNWNVLYRTDELTGFQKELETDNQTYVNITLWKNLEYNGYEFRLALRYHLGLMDQELTVIPYIKNLGVDIPYELGFAWEITDIQIDMTPEDDYILINDSCYWLNETLDLSFTNLTRPVYCWNDSLNDTVVCGYEPNSEFHIQENISDGLVRSLYLRWNPDVNYKVWITSRNGSYNAPVVFGIRIGDLSAGESKYTRLYWYDAEQQSFYFDAYSGSEYWQTRPGYMTDNQLSTYASTNVENQVQRLTGHSHSGSDLGSISKVELRAYAKRQGGISYLALRPVFGSGDGDTHGFMLSSSAQWSDWFDITSDTNAPEGWTWEHVYGLDCEVEGVEFDELFGSMVYCAKVELRVTYTEWTPPCISNPSPGHGTRNASIAPRVGITVADEHGQSLDISWLSNCTGEWQVFGTNNSVGNGTFYQTLEGADVNGQWWYWMVNVSNNGASNLSNVFKCYTGVQSKISNTGACDVYGFLRMQVEYWNDSSWVLERVVIDDTSPRVVNMSSELGLDLVFNGLVDVGDLGFGDGTYRVYAALCDPWGDPLVVGEDELEAWWCFEVALG